MLRRTTGLPESIFDNPPMVSNFGSLPTHHDDLLV
jgi:hypothetical protein